MYRLTSIGDRTTYSSAFLLIWSLGMASCSHQTPSEEVVTPSPIKSTKPMLTQTDQAPSRPAPSNEEGSLSDSENQASLDDETVNQRSWNRKTENSMGPWLEKLLELDKPLDDQDIKILGLIPKSPRHNSIAEASLVLALIKNSALNQTKYSLLQQAQAFELDLVRALSDNPFLASEGVFNLFLLAVKDPALKDSAIARVKSRYDQWMVHQPLFEPEKTVIVEKGSGSKKPAPVIKAFSDPEELIAEAERMAADGQSVEAVRLLQTIDYTSPYYEQTRENIKTLSNKEVADLRKKAAIAFQNALPVTDASAKKSYLEEAALHLQKALDQFPEADQLETVRANLIVIKGSLESMATD